MDFVLLGVFIFVAIVWGRFIVEKNRRTATSRVDRNYNYLSRDPRYYERGIGSYGVLDAHEQMIAQLDTGFKHIDDGWDEYEDRHRRDTMFDT